MSCHNPCLAFNGVIYKEYLLFFRRIGGKSLWDFNRHISHAQQASCDTTAPATRRAPAHSPGGVVETATPAQLGLGSKSGESIQDERQSPEEEVYASDVKFVSDSEGSSSDGKYHGSLENMTLEDDYKDDASPSASRAPAPAEVARVAADSSHAPPASPAPRACVAASPRREPRVPAAPESGALMLAGARGAPVPRLGLAQAVAVLNCLQAIEERIEALRLRRLDVPAAPSASLIHHVPATPMLL